MSGSERTAFPGRSRFPASTGAREKGVVAEFSRVRATLSPASSSRWAALSLRRRIASGAGDVKHKRGPASMAPSTGLQYVLLLLVAFLSIPALAPVTANRADFQTPLREADLTEIPPANLTDKITEAQIAPLPSTHSGLDTSVHSNPGHPSASPSAPSATVALSASTDSSSQPSNQRANAAHPAPPSTSSAPPTHPPRAVAEGPLGNPNSRSWRNLSALARAPGGGDGEEWRLRVGVKRWNAGNRNRGAEAEDEEYDDGEGEVEEEWEGDGEEEAEDEEEEDDMEADDMEADDMESGDMEADDMESGDMEADAAEGGEWHEGEEWGEWERDEDGEEEETGDEDGGYGEEHEEDRHGCSSERDPRGSESTGRFEAPQNSSEREALGSQSAAPDRWTDDGDAAAGSWAEGKDSAISTSANETNSGSGNSGSDSDSGSAFSSWLRNGTSPRHSTTPEEIAARRELRKISRAKRARTASPQRRKLAARGRASAGRRPSRGRRPTGKKAAKGRGKSVRRTAGVGGGRGKKGGRTSRRVSPAAAAKWRSRSPRSRVVKPTVVKRRPPTRKRRPPARKRGGSRTVRSSKSSRRSRKSGKGSGKGKGSRRTSVRGASAAARPKRRGAPRGKSVARRSSSKRKASAGGGGSKQVDCQYSRKGYGQNLYRCAMGYAKRARVTGGLGKPVYVVRSSADYATVPKYGTLRWALQWLRGGCYIRFATSMTIRLNARLFVPSHTSIDGRGAWVKLIGSLDVVNVTNVIIHNIEVENELGNHDLIHIRSSWRVWVDHCNVRNGVRGTVDVVRGSTDVTISNCYIHNRDLTMLLGAADWDSIDKRMRVTVYRNWFDKSGQRLPHCRWGQFHVVNNLYTNWGFYCLGGRAYANIRSERNVFLPGQRKEVTPWFGVSALSTPGFDNSPTIVSVGDALLNGATFHQFKGTKQPFSPAYRIPMLTPNTAAQLFLAKNAGPQLRPPVLPCSGKRYCA